MDLAVLRVRQWLSDWDSFAYRPDLRQSRPERIFFVCSISARVLRSISGVYTRVRDEGVVEGHGLQRELDADKALELSTFLHAGFPFSGLSRAKKTSHQYDDLKKPGWLPTAIVANIVAPGEHRGTQTLEQRDAIELIDGHNSRLTIPDHLIQTGLEGRLAPVEIIDGQHRLAAIGPDIDESFEIPVVFYHHLDLSWQAYLFWVINIKPKRINPSLAFDLYPLLRGEDWLDRADNLQVYRQTRAQEIAEILWALDESPWRNRIDMLGTGGRKQLSLNAFVNALTASFIKTAVGRGVRNGGLFGGISGAPEELLSWNRAQQSAFIVLLWQEILLAVRSNRPAWLELLQDKQRVHTEDVAATIFTQDCLLNQDQGVNAVLGVVNDIAFRLRNEFNFSSWQSSAESSPGEDERARLSSVKDALNTARENDVGRFIEAIASALCTFDWRSSSGVEDEDTRRTKLTYRGSGGYRILRFDILTHLREEAAPEFQPVVRELLDQLGNR